METFLLELRKQIKKGRNDFQIFYDIETYNYNTYKGRKNPSMYKTYPYSVCFGILDEKGRTHLIALPSFYSFFHKIMALFQGKKAKVTLWAHNGNKYDHHFLRSYLIKEEGFKCYNRKLKQATDEANSESYYPAYFEKQSIDHFLLEQRVKSRVDLSFIFQWDKVLFNTADTFPITDLSLRELGKKLSNHGYIKKSEEKTTLDYEKYDLNGDMSYKDARKRAEQIFLKLTPDEKKYIFNDVIILSNTYKYYSELFYGFERDKRTLTVSISETYTKPSPLTSWQLLRSTGRHREENPENSNFKFSGLSLYTYLKRSYKGGLNFYNDKFLAEIIDGPFFYIDLNSSYPAVLYKGLVPTFLEKARENDGKEFEFLPDLSEKVYQIYEISRLEMHKLLKDIGSDVVCKMMTKYYNGCENYYINNIFLSILRDYFGYSFQSRKIKIYSYLEYRCYPFGGRDIIDKFYRIKQEGKSENALIYKNPCEIREGQSKNTKKLTPAEVDNAKICLNGVYGIPALRNRFDLFRWDGESFINYPNGYKNRERNLALSSWVTAKALRQLLKPFKYLTDKEIDENFIYCDTDSMILREKVRDLLPPDLFDRWEIGKWAIEDDGIQKFFVLNHKKYCYLDKNNTIKFRCAGIHSSDFTTSGLTFDDFVKTQFSDGIEKKSTRSILNTDETITIYQNKIKMEKGTIYPITPLSSIQSKIVQELPKVLYDLVHNHDDDHEEFIYLESPIGSFSLSNCDIIFNEQDENAIKYGKEISELIKSDKDVKKYLTNYIGYDMSE